MQPDVAPTTTAIYSSVFRIDVDPLTKEPIANPFVPPPPFSFESIQLSPDGRILALDSLNSPIGRARYYPWRSDWSWLTDEESVVDYTIRELADASKQGFGVLDGDFSVEPNRYDDPYFIGLLQKVSNQLIVGSALNMRVVFERFNQRDWERVVSQWPEITQTFSVGKLPSGFDFNWRRSDRVIDFAEREGLTVRVIALFMAKEKDLLDSVYAGRFSADDLSKILEFMVKARVIKYKGRVHEWVVATELAGSVLFGTETDRFWMAKLGSDITDRVAQWKYDVDADSKAVYIENHITEIDTANFRAMRAKSYEFIKHFAAFRLPIQKVGIEYNAWIYAPTAKEAVLADLAEIRRLGFDISSSEATVNISTGDPLWQRRQPVIESISSPLEAQAAQYRELLEAYLTAQADFGLGGLTDSTGWLSNTGRPQTKAMIFDDDGRPKPAYFALRDALKKHLGLT